MSGLSNTVSIITS